jgi:hypothetical protein
MKCVRPEYASPYMILVVGTRRSGSFLPVRVLLTFRGILPTRPSDESSYAPFVPAISFHTSTSSARYAFHTRHVAFVSRRSRSHPHFIEERMQPRDLGLQSCL